MKNLIFRSPQVKFIENDLTKSRKNSREASS